MTLHQSINQIEPHDIQALRLLRDVLGLDTTSAYTILIFATARLRRYQFEIEDLKKQLEAAGGAYVDPIDAVTRRSE